MSLFVEARSVSFAAFSGNSHTLISRPFARSLGLVVGCSAMFTTTVPGYGTLSTSIAPVVTDDSTFEVSLGLDWSSSVKETLNFLGYALGSSFDAWTFLVHASHPHHKAEMSHEIIRGVQKAAEEFVCGGQLLGPVLQGSLGYELHIVFRIMLTIRPLTGRPVMWTRHGSSRERRPYFIIAEPFKVRVWYHG
ncbi:hypothetical protein B0H13DRAFT_1935546 [Mycena leptocephala]|nr:hypothetical protein B0H13DRAFT_1935546 [Mycena leptocephala]